MRGVTSRARRNRQRLNRGAGGKRDGESGRGCCLGNRMEAGGAQHVCAHCTDGSAAGLSGPEPRPGALTQAAPAELLPGHQGAMA